MCVDRWAVLRDRVGANGSVGVVRGDRKKITRRLKI